MPSAGWYQNGIAGGDRAKLALDTTAYEDEIELLAQLVKVALGGSADGDGRFGEGLILHGRIS